MKEYRPSSPIAISLCFRWWNSWKVMDNRLAAELRICCIVLQLGNFELAWRMNIAVAQLQKLRVIPSLWLYYSIELRNRSHSQVPSLGLLYQLFEKQSSTPATSLRSFGQKRAPLFEYSKHHYCLSLMDKSAEIKLKRPRIMNI